METTPTFGQWLRLRRKALDLTQEDVARIVQCSISEVRKVESDERRPSRQIADLLANCLNIPLSEREAFIQAARSGRSPANPRWSNRSPLAIPVPAALPNPATVLMGREPEMAQIGRLLGQPDCRLLTLFGAGGIGKTRLSIEAARSYQSLFPDGVFFISLSPIRSSDLLISTIAGTVACDFYGPEEPAVQLANHLQDKSVLLVLDNIEHLSAGTAVLSRLLQRTQSLKMLITSRERLNLQGEWVFEIQGLPVPPAGQTENLEHYSSVGLFLQCAQRVQTDFNPGPEELAAIAQICRQVDGLPLGIELAAIWVRVLSCAEIAREIAADFNFLSTNLRDIPERHRSLRAVFDHTWSLLSDDEQRVMMYLAAFRGSFRREAAIEVAGASLPILSTLVDKCLLRRVATGIYNIHELVRQYATARLKTDPEAYTEAYRRVSDYYLNLLQAQERALRGPQQSQALANLSTEIDNIRLAWDWAVDHGCLETVAEAARALTWFYELHGWYQEGQDVFAQSAETLSSGNDPRLRAIRGQLLASSGFFLTRAGLHEQACTALEDSLGLLREAGKPIPLADALAYLGGFLLRTGDYGRMEAAFSESIALSRAAGYDWNVASCLSTWATALLTLGKLDQAVTFFREALGLWRKVGDPRSIAFALTFLGSALHEQGQHQEAHELLHEGLALSKTCGDRYATGASLSNLAAIAYAHGEFDEAESLFNQSAGLFEELGDHWSRAQVLNNLGFITIERGSHEQARSYFLEALKTAQENQTMPVAVSSLVGLSDLLARQGQSQKALELLAQVSAQPNLPHESRGRAEQLLSLLSSELPEDERQQLESSARSQPFSPFVAELLSSLE